MCKHCKDYTQKVYAREDSRIFFGITSRFLKIINDKHKTGIMTFEINYCPMCGHKLVV